METHDIEEIKLALECMSNQEKIEYLHNVQNEIRVEIEELEAAENGVEELLSDALTQVEEKYNSEITAALNDIIAAHPGEVCTLNPNNTLDIEGLRSRFIWQEEGFDQLYIYISGRKHIIRTGDFNAEFKEILKQLLPDAKYDNMSFHFRIGTEADTAPLVKDIAEKLVAIAPKIAELARKYRFA